MKTIWVLMGLLGLIHSAQAAETMVFEAESGKLIAPMVLSEDKQSVYSTVKYKGSTKLQINVPAKGLYEMEFKVSQNNKNCSKIKAQINSNSAEVRFCDQGNNWHTGDSNKIKYLRLEQGPSNVELKALDTYVFIDAFRLIPIDVEEPALTQQDDSDASAPASDDSSSGDSSGEIASSNEPALYQPPAAASSSDQSRNALLKNLIGFAQGTTGGLEGPECQVTTLADDGDGSLRKCATKSTPQWITFKVSGTIQLKSPISVNNNKTIDGRGQDITIVNYGLKITSKENVILHNLTIKDAEDDAVKVYKSKKIWVDHLSVSNTTDGLVDITEQSNAVTVSWTRFEDHNKTLLIGASNSSDGDKNIHVTLHHNYHYRTIRRNPLVRFARVHIFNNVFQDWGDGTSGDAVASTYYAQVALENNVFMPAEEYRRALRIDVSGYIPEQGYVRASGNLTLGEAKVFDNHADKVFTPASLYGYSASTANESLYELVSKNAGRQDSPAWSQSGDNGSTPAADEAPQNACAIPCALAADDFDLIDFTRSADGSFYSTSRNYTVEDDSPEAQIEVELAQAASYQLEVYNVSPSGTEDSVFLQVNGGEIQTLHLGYSGSALRKKVISNVPMQSGLNKITIFGREPNSRVYQVLIKN